MRIRIHLRVFAEATLAAVLIATQARAADTQNLNLSSTPIGAIANARFGTSVAYGDLDGDGKFDLVVGAPFASPNSVSGAGAIFVFRATTAGACASGTTAGFTLVDASGGSGGYPGWFRSNPIGGAALGWSVALADEDGDGKMDIIAGAPQTDRTDLDISFIQVGEVAIFRNTSSGVGAYPSTSRTRSCDPRLRMEAAHRRLHTSVGRSRAARWRRKPHRRPP